MSRCIKVLHVIDKFGVRGSSIHGVTRLFSWWFPRFDRSRYAVRLVGLRPADSASEILRSQGLDVMSLGKSKFDVSTLGAMVRLIRAERADILHLHSYGASNFGRAAARLTGVKTIVHEHIVDPAMPAYQVAADYLLSRWTDRGIATCEAVRAFMVRRRHVPAARTTVLFNGIPLREFTETNGAHLAEERLRWGIPDGHAVVASIGRIDEQKGNGYLMEAAARLLRVGRRLVVMLVGDGPLVEPLKAQSRALGIERQVIFTGHQQDIPRLQSMLDLQVIPSLWEGTTLTVFEAMARRLPIVATPVDGLGEVLRDGENARLVPPRDGRALADAIAALLDDPSQARRLAACAQADSRRYDVQQTVERMQGIYEELAR